MNGMLRFTLTLDNRSAYLAGDGGARQEMQVGQIEKDRFSLWDPATNINDCFTQQVTWQHD